MLRRLRRESLLDKAARFVACEMIEGDYLEFGVYQGTTFTRAYRALKEQFADRMQLQIGGDDAASSNVRRQEIWNNMRFFAFDSFEGLPALTGQDTATADFEKGQYAFSVDEFRRCVRKGGVPDDRVRIVPGWFDNTCTETTRQAHELTRAALVWIDADLYSSAKTALDFITPLLQDGTVIVFDDWYSYKGNPKEGEQRAFHEWQHQLTGKFVVNEYQKETWKRNSFIVSTA